ncbi:class I SAM-dependent methyltransferase [Archangium lansingense]|uniref:Class I SAM-dependent methyltransferase n=1 Tax=Archangium lansingense TaxID=2995310 RepID=A0ABT4ALS4_9BACT|nr:class I SAM-dependent methyltransferase [Archangium lansinium]MCY1082667.1 class I SAM-dependent methyltransferase [Archangium lansinium]
MTLSVFSTHRRASCSLFTAVLLLATACAHQQPEARHEEPSHTKHSHGEHHGAIPHRFENAEEWAKRFEEPERDAWQKPDEVVKALALPPDAKVADIGAGTGYFAVRLARAVPQGRVYGVDIEPDMARYLGERAKRESLSHLEAVLGEPGDAKLPEPVDVVLIVNTYHHIGDRVAYMKRLGEKLRPGGRVVIIDFREESPKGPPRQHKLSPEQVRGELEAAGYGLAHTHDFLPDQYILVFQRG